MEEIWKPIKEYEDLYEVSNLGRIKSKDRITRNGKSNYCIKKGKILKIGSNSLGYAIIGLWKDKKQRFFQVHRIVAETFIKNSENKKEVNHKDGNKRNNNIENLEWVTRSENVKHAIKHGLLIIKGNKTGRKRSIKMSQQGR